MFLERSRGIEDETPPAYNEIPDKQQEIFEKTLLRIADPSAQPWQSLMEAHKFISDIRLSALATGEHDETEFKEGKLMTELYIATMNRIGNANDPGLLGLFRMLVNEYQYEHDMSQLDAILELIDTDLQPAYIATMAERLNKITNDPESLYPDTGDRNR